MIIARILYLSCRPATCTTHLCPPNPPQVILGTEYAGEMKKGIFSLMHYLMPKRGVLSLHSGCNVGVQGDVTLFFGLSGETAPSACWRTKCNACCGPACSHVPACAAFVLMTLPTLRGASSASPPPSASTAACTLRAAPNPTHTFA